MKARDLVVVVLLVFPACDDGPVGPRTGPKAAFGVKPESGWTDTTFWVDASASSDPDDRDSALSVRWDWEGDGVWDTDWSKEKRATHRYWTEGVKAIRLEVRDPSEQRGRAARNVNVMLAPVMDSPAVVVSTLSRAYQSQDSELLMSLLADDPDRDADFRFVLSDPFDVPSWGFDEEVRIHRRMFHPESPPPGDPPVPADLWLQSMQITLTQQEPFGERLDLYTTWDPPGPLDPLIWRATDARYTTYVYFDLAGTDYSVEGEANFVVIEDLTKNVGDTGKFLLYIWEDIAMLSNKPASEMTWSVVKSLFR